MSTAINVLKRGNGIVEIQLHRPEKHNALNFEMLASLRQAFLSINEKYLRSAEASAGKDEDDVRVILLTGEGKNFCSGIDVMSLGGALNVDTGDVARNAVRLYNGIRFMQECLSEVERSPVPVIAVIHGLCLGAGVDLVSCCDIRVATDTAVFSIKEVDLGIAADMGTLQRLPSLVRSQGTLKEWAYTGRRFGSAEALAAGFLNDASAKSTPEAHKLALTVAECISSKDINPSPFTSVRRKSSCALRAATGLRSSMMTASRLS